VREKRIIRDVEQRLAPLRIDRVALGIRFQPHFGVADVFGELVDRILRSAETPFDSSRFPLVRSNPTERVLVNEETNETLHLNIRDAILEVNVDTIDLREIERLAVQFSRFVATNLRELAAPAGIERYGCLLKFGECHEALGELPTDHYLSDEFEDARTLQLRFTRRLPCIEARVRKNVDDFRNVIHIVEQDDEGNVNIRADYQEYFKPALCIEDWRAKPFEDFVARGLEYFETGFAEWLRNLQPELAAVE